MSFKIYKLYVRVLFKTLAKPHELEEFYEIFQDKLEVKVLEAANQESGQIGAQLRGILGTPLAGTNIQKLSKSDWERIKG